MVMGILIVMSASDNIVRKKGNSSFNLWPGYDTSENVYVNLAGVAIWIHFIL